MTAMPQNLLEALDDTALGTSEVGGERTVFRAFEVGEFLEWPAWRRLLRILRSNGGSFGLSGARGAGKSWLMLRAIEWVRGADGTGRLGGIGLWYPSPSEYDPLAFLASLSDSFGTEIDRWFRRNPKVRRRHAMERGAFVVAGGAAAFLFLNQLVNQPWLPWTVVAAAVLAAGFGVVLWAIRRGPGSFPRESRLAAEAKVVRERARYTATRRETSELAAEGGRGLIARARTARERELVERPATLSSLVNDFRALATEAGEVAGRVVIAIDELDKMAEADKVRALLRDIKGIFEVPHVHFLVSVSDEAARRLSIGALAGRNEFNSSFYTVIEAQPTTPEALADLLERRTEACVPRDVALVLAVLAGGNPREVLRLAEFAATVTSAAEAATEALEDEALTLRREVVTAQDVEGFPMLKAEARVRAFAALPEASFATAEGLSALATTALSNEMWEPQWQDGAFRVRFGEAWRRLMIRLAVASQLAESRSLVRDPDLGLRLRDVIVAASQSAEVARIVLEQQLRVDTRRPAVQQEQARRRLTALARNYESLRKSKGASDQRTEKMDAIAADARALARDASFTTAEVTRLLASDAPGDRVLGLAAIEATGDPGGFEPVLAAVLRPPTPFEGFHALRALETLSPSLTPSQRTEVRKALVRAGDTDFAMTLRARHSRTGSSRRSNARRPRQHDQPAAAQIHRVAPHPLAGGS